MEAAFPGMPDKWKSDEGEPKRKWKGVDYFRTGPWSYACKHMECENDGTSSHAAVAVVKGCLWYSGPHPRITRVGCLESNLQFIDKADIVTAHLARKHCYGTYAEIGYAFARGKIVFLLFDGRQMNLAERADQWYFAQMSLQSLEKAPVEWNERLPTLPIVDTWKTLGEYREYLNRMVFQHFKNLRDEQRAAEEAVDEAEMEADIKAEAATKPDAVLSKSGAN